MIAPTDVPTPPAPSRHPFPWLPVLILGFAWFLAVAIELGPAGLLNDIARDLDVSIAAAGTLTTFYALGNALLVLPLTSFALRFARRPVLVIVMAALAISTAAVALSSNLFLADAGRFIGGASYALICTLFPAVVIRIAGPGNAGKAITVVFTATSLGTAFGAPLASLVGAATGWRPTFLGASVLVAVAGILMWFVVPRVREHTEETLGLLRTARLPGVMRVAIGWSFVMLAHFVVLTYIDAYLEELGVPRYITSVALSLTGIGGIIGTLLIGQVSRRSFYAALVVAPITVAIGFIVLIGGGDAIVVVLVGVALWGIGLAAMVVVYQQGLLLTGARAPETATSIGVLLAQAGFAVGASVGGITIETLGIRAIPAVALIFVIASIAIALTLRQTITRAQEEEKARNETENPSARTVTGARALMTKRKNR
ncbi:MFS transporter [Microbacteriaceae bacterium VKM Ac-2854]|nr:MFS transporter [Microbacteriaceae bacterium VKM Ac-2854]